MNEFMQEQWPTFEGTFKMRAQLFDSLNDSDPAFSPGGLFLSSQLGVTPGSDHSNEPHTNETA
jgi:hypothetical protein